MMDIRVGYGYDVHALVENRSLWMGGILIPYERGLAGHSDADVLIHAICDALLGAAGLRDIGFHFPDTDASFKDVDSKLLLKQVRALLNEKGWRIGNVDATIAAEKPKFNPHIPAMQACLAALMGVEADAVSIKATTSEKLGFVGRKEGISAAAVVLISR